MHLLRAPGHDSCRTEDAAAPISPVWELQPAWPARTIPLPLEAVVPSRKVPPLLVKSEESRNAPGARSQIPAHAIQVLIPKAHAERNV
jgi:hypothetical protein